METKKKLVAVCTSVMAHVVALSYVSFDAVFPEPKPPPLEVSLLDEAVERSSTPKSVESAPRDAVPRPFAGGDRMRAKAKRGVRSDGSVRPSNLPDSPGLSTGTEGTPADQEGPPRPAAGVSLPYVRSLPPGGEEGEGPSIERGVPRPKKTSPIEPLLGGLDTSAPGEPESPPNERGWQGTGEGGAGAGIGFDFWAPPVFAEEIARAQAELWPREEALRKEATTDLGHGVICNTAGSWFICDDALARCNARHDGMCRYAKASERRDILTPVIF